MATRNAGRLRPFVSLLSDEVNVRSVELTELADDDDRVSRQLSVNARAAGPRLGKDVQKVIKASKAGDWSVDDDGSVICGGVPLVEGEYTLELVAAGSSSDAVGLLRSGGFVSLDTVLDDELVADGNVSDVLRLVQQARKDAGLQVSDRIDLALEVSDELWAAVQARVEKVKAETLALIVSQGRGLRRTAGSAGRGGRRRHCAGRRGEGGRLMPDNPVVFVHGLWMHASSWNPWIERFQAAGYQASAAGWPGDPDTIEEARANPRLMAGYGLEEIVEHHKRYIGGLDSRPIVIGHSFGGLIAQRLLAEDFAVGGVAIDPAPIKGVLRLPFSSLKVACRC